MLAALPDVAAASMSPIRTILLATDLMASSSEATARAIDLAAHLEARLLIVNVLEKRRLAGGGAHERVDQARTEREQLLVKVVRDARGAGVTAEFMVWEGDPGSSIATAAEAEQADLIVVGTADGVAPAACCWAPSRTTSCVMRRALCSSCAPEVSRNS